MENQIRSKKDFFAEWLEKLQQESWQLELLISGLALYGIYASQDVITSLEYYFTVNNNSSFGFIPFIIIDILWISRTIFLINLLIHIIVRGFWIGAIGLRYVSGDIDYKELNYSDRFTSYYKKKIGSFDGYIEKLENFSSVLFSFTFLLFFLLVSFFSFNLIIIASLSLLNKIPFLTIEIGKTSILVILGFCYYLAGMIVLVDFLTNSSLKKTRDKTINGVYFWIYRFYSIVSLSFLYRPILLNFLDNKFTKRLFYMSGPYIILLLFFSGINIDRHEYFPTFSTNDSNYHLISENIINFNYYDDKRREYVESLEVLGKRKRRPSIKTISLSQYEVDKSELSFFLEYELGDTKELEYNNDSLYKYRKGGLRHSRQNNKAKDQIIQNIVDRELHDIKLSAKYGTSDSLNNVITTKYGDFDDNKKELRDRIVESYELEKEKYERQKSKDIKNAIINLYDIRLNNQAIRGNLDCKYYIHPNMMEKGLLCYLNIDTLSYKGHMISVRKSNKSLLNIPFRKIKQN